MKVPRSGPKAVALAAVVLVVLVVALTTQDLSKYQDPLFPGVKIAKPDMCWWIIPCDKVFTLGYAAWLGSQAAYVTVSHGLNNGDSIYQPCYYDCGGEPTGYVGKIWDRELLYVDAAVLKIEQRSTQASPHIEICGFNPAFTSVDGYFTDAELQYLQGQTVWSMYRIGHVTGCKGGQARIYFYDPQYCLLSVYYDPQWQPAQEEDSGSPLFQLRSEPIVRSWHVKVAGIFVGLRPADNPQFMEFMGVECVNRFYGLGFRYGT